MTIYCDKKIQNLSKQRSFGVLFRCFKPALWENFTLTVNLHSSAIGP